MVKPIFANFRCVLSLDKMPNITKCFLFLIFSLIKNMLVKALLTWRNEQNNETLFHKSLYCINGFFDVRLQQFMIILDVLFLFTFPIIIIGASMFVLYFIKWTLKQPSLLFQCHENVFNQDLIITIFFSKSNKNWSLFSVVFI